LCTSDLNPHLEHLRCSHAYLMRNGELGYGGLMYSRTRFSKVFLSLVGVVSPKENHVYVVCVNLVLLDV
jgi:hypothetical protein